MNLEMDELYTFKYGEYKYCTNNWDDKPIDYLDKINYRGDEFIIIGWDSSDVKKNNKDLNYLYYLAVSTKTETYNRVGKQIINLLDNLEELEKYIEQLGTHSRMELFTHIRQSEIKEAVTILNAEKNKINLSFTDLMI